MTRLELQKLLSFAFIIFDGHPFPFSHFLHPFPCPHLLQIRPSAWRYSVPAVSLPGESWNVEEYDVKNVISYDGEAGEGGQETGPYCGTPFPTVCLRGGLTYLIWLLLHFKVRLHLGRPGRILMPGPSLPTGTLSLAVTLRTSSQGPASTSLQQG